MYICRLHEWTSTDVYRLILKKLTKHDLEFVYHAHGSTRPFTNDILDYCAKRGYLECLQLVHETGVNPYELTVKCAAANGRLNCLKYLTAYVSFNYIVRYAAGGGSIECVKYLLGLDYRLAIVDANFAACRGQLHVLEYMHAEGLKFENDTESAIDNACDHLHCIKYLHEHGCSLKGSGYTPLIVKICGRGRLDCLKHIVEAGCEYDSTALEWAAAGCHIECIEYLMRKPVTKTADIIRAAVTNGHDTCLLKKDGTCNSWHLQRFASDQERLKVLKYLHQHNFPWDGMATATAAMYNHIECLRYLHENGCPWGWYTISASTRYGNINCIKYAYENGCAIDEFAAQNAAEAGQLECLKYIHENGAVLTIKAAKSAVKYDNVDCLRYLHENGCLIDITIMNRAVSLDRIECVKYLHEIGCPWDITTMIACCGSSWSKDTSCVQYLHENGCPWDAAAAAASVENNPDILVYLHENGCEWDWRTTSAAITHGDLWCLQYAHENGCEWASTCPEITNKSEKCLEYALKNGCGW